MAPGRTPKEPTRAQLSSKLAYQSHTPSFLLKLQNQFAGIPNPEDEYDQDDDEFEYVGEGREPIPRRPAIPERPAEDPGSADEDDGDEKPQVVVLKEGKHLTEREAENIRRREKGLAPLPDPEDIIAQLANPSSSSSSSKDTPKAKTQSQGLSFSSSSSSKQAPKKRKAIGQLDDEKDSDTGTGGKKGSKGSNTASKKKPKKASKTLLSFGDDA